MGSASERAQVKASSLTLPTIYKTVPQRSMVLNGKPTMAKTYFLKTLIVTGIAILLTSGCSSPHTASQDSRSTSYPIQTANTSLEEDQFVGNPLVGGGSADVASSARTSHGDVDIDAWISIFEIQIDNLDGNIKSVSQGLETPGDLKDDLKNGQTMENLAKHYIDSAVPRGFERSHRAIDSFLNNYFVALDSGSINNIHKNLVTAVVFELKACDNLISDAKVARLEATKRSSILADLGDIRSGLMRDYPKAATLYWETR